jgi:hypothetical protein
MVNPVNVATGVPLVLVVGAVQVSVAVPFVAGLTVTVALWVAGPPAPVQVSVNTVVAVTAGVFADPLVASAPLHPPEAVQDVAFVDDQVSADALPLATVLGFADSVMVGAGVVTETVAVCVALLLLPPVQERL